MHWKRDPLALQVERLNGGWRMKGWYNNLLLFNRFFEKGEVYSDQEAVDTAVELLIRELRQALIGILELKIEVEEGSL